MLSAVPALVGLLVLICSVPTAYHGCDENDFVPNKN